MKSAITIALILAASPVFADEAASALADCQAHQQRLQELEDSYAPPPEPNTEAFYTPGQFGENALQHERVLTERACDYAKMLRAESPRRAPKAEVTQRAPFRSDEPAPATDGGSAARGRMPEPPPASKPPVFDEHPPVAPAPPMPPPPPVHRAVMRRPPPPPPPQSNVGGTKARHAPDDSQQQAPPQQ